MVSNRGRPGGTSIRSSERLSDVVADEPAAPRRLPDPVGERYAPMYSTAVIGRLPCGPGLECVPAVPGRMRNGPVHGRFRVERLIPTSFNQTLRLLRRAQAWRLTRLCMLPLFRPSLVSLLAIWLALPASAQDGPLDLPASNAASLPSNTPPSLTGKERLGKKWMDEQRMDNCKVPIDKRGTRPRPSTCPHVPLG
jgi:hypothetical protein